MNGFYDWAPGRNTLFIIVGIAPFCIGYWNAICGGIGPFII